MLIAKKANLNRAIADCNKAIELNPKLVQAYNNRGAAYNEKGENLTVPLQTVTKP